MSVSYNEGEMSPHKGKRKASPLRGSNDRDRRSRPSDDTTVDWTDVDNDGNDVEDHASRLKINPGETEDFDEWRREHRGRGRKRRSKRGSGQRRSRNGDRD
jgi:hypothetical protein